MTGQLRSLTPEQLAVLRRADAKADAEDLARRLGIPRKRVDEALESLARPAWHGREHPALAALLALLILFAGWLGYRDNGACSFHFDDNHVIVANDPIRTLHRKINAASREGESPVRRAKAWAGALEPTAKAIYEFNLYRMVTYWSFALTYHDHPLDEAKDRDAILVMLEGWHAANNRIHYLNGLLVMWVAWLTLTAPVFRRAPSAVPWPILIAGLAGLLFVTHPVQVQAVTYLTQRTESLACTFYLLGLGLYATARRREHGPTRGAAPWKTGLVLGATGVLLGVAAVTATTDLLQLKGLVRLSLLIVAAGLAAIVALVRRGDDEPAHAACTVGAFLAFALGLQTKEIVATLPFAVVAWDLLFVPPAADAKPASGWLVARLARVPGRPWLRGTALRGAATRARDLGPWAAMVGGVSVLAVVFGGANFARKLMAEGVAEGGVGEATAEQLTTFTYLLTEQNVLCTYLRMFLLPYGQHLDHDYAIVPRDGALGHGVTWLALLSGLLVLATVGLALWRGGRARVPAFALLAGLLVLGPTSSVIVLPDVIYEHRFYVPLALAAVAALVTLERALRAALPDGRRAAVLVAVGLALAAVGVHLTRRRNEAFLHEVSLWKDNTEKSPKKPRGWTNLGLAYQNLEPTMVQHKGEVRGGRAIKLPDGTVLVHTTTDARQKPRVIKVGEPFAVGPSPVEGGPELAAAAYQTALELEPRYTKALNNLAIIHINLAKIERYQVDALGQLAKQRGDLAATCQKEAEARVAAFKQHSAAASGIYERVCGLHPKDPIPWSNRANCVAELEGDYDRAIEFMTIAIQLGAPVPSVCTLGEYYRAKGERVYMEAQAAGRDALAAAKPYWEAALALYERYLLSQDPTFRDTAQVRLKTVREWADGKVPTAPGAPPPPGR